MKAFIRENPLIAASVALPLGLIVVFALAGYIPKLIAPAPEHDLLLVDRRVSRYEAGDFGISIVVDDGKVMARIDYDDDRVNVWRSRLYRVDHETLAIRELEVDWPPAAAAAEDGELLPVAELENVTVSTSTLSPDGYLYRGYERGQGLLLGLFGSNSPRNQVSIAKDGAVVRIRIPEPDGYGYGFGQMEFLGWVTEP